MNIYINIYIYKSVFFICSLNLREFGLSTLGGLGGGGVVTHDNDSVTSWTFHWFCWEISRAPPSPPTTSSFT